MYFNQLKNAAALLVAMLLVACGSGNQTEKTASSEFDQVKEKVAIDFKKIMEDLPPPSKVPYLLLEASSNFDPDFVHTTDSIEKYQSSFESAAFNLGIYSSDIAYLVSHDATDKAIDMMGECQKLAGAVGLSHVIDYELVARFERNIENRDSVAAITDEVMEKSGEKLVELDHLDGFVLLLAGKWIEGLYLANSIVQSYPEDMPDEERVGLMTPLLKIVLDQEESLDRILGIIDSMPESENLKTAKANLEEIKKNYGALEEVDTAIHGFTDTYVLRPSAISEFAAVVKKIRSQIIS